MSCLHDFEYGFVAIDVMSRRFSQWEVSRLLILAGVAASRSICPSPTLLVSVPLYKLMRVGSCELGSSLFTNRRLALVEGCVSCVSCALVLLFAIAGDEVKNDITLSLIGLVMVPLAACLPMKLREMKDAKIIDENLGKTNLNHLSPD